MNCVIFLLIRDFKDYLNNVLVRYMNGLLSKDNNYLSYN